MRIPDPMQFPVQPNAASGMAFMGTGESIPVLIVNQDAANTIYVSYRNQSKVGDPNTVPLQPGQSVIMDGARTLYVIGPTGTANAVIIPGGTNFFQPTNLSAIGGAKVFVQSATPTGTIPLNSVWFDTANNSLQTWNGSAWVNQQFNATQLIQIATITASQVANATLTTTQLAAAAGILGTQIANATITSGNIAANTIVAGNIAANTITAAQLAAGIIYAGIVDGTTIQGAIFRAKNSFGATILTVNKSAGTWLLYADTGSATQGALVASAAQAAGTDEFSNAFAAGIQAYGTGGSTTSVQLLPGNPVLVNVATGDSMEGTPAGIRARVIGSGATRFLSNDFRGAFAVGALVNPLAQLQIFSPNQGLTTEAGLNLSVGNMAGTQNSLMHQLPSSFSFGGAFITADRPIQVTDSINTWAADQSIGSANQITKTNPTAAVDITSTLTIPANNANVGTCYIIEMPFSGLWEASGALNLQFDLDGTFTNLVPIAAGLAVAGHNYGGRFILCLEVLTTGAGGTCNIWGDGGVTDTSVSRAGATSSDLFGINAGHAFDTTVSHTLAIAASFSVSNASQTIQSKGAIFSRKGL